MLEALKEWNPWWATKRVEPAYLGKSRLKHFLNLFNIKGMLKVVVGPRRAGKTTLLYQYIDYLIKKGVEPTSILYLNLEDPTLENYSLEEMYYEFIRASKSKHNYIILDEVQAKPAWHRWIRTMIDKKTGDEFIISGSTSSLLEKSISSLLAGRFITIKVYPFSFYELTENLGPMKKDQAIAEGILETTLMFGCYPEVFFRRGAEKRIILNSYVETIAAKDVADAYNLDYEKAKEMFLYLIRNAGTPTSINKLRRYFRIRYETAERYINALKSAMVVFEVRRYSYALKEQLMHPRKFYPIDVGFRNIIQSPTKDKGRLLEAYTAIECIKQGYSLYYHKKQKECDFILVKNGRPVLALQVTYELSKNKQRELEGLKEAMQSYNIKGMIITRNNIVEFLRSILPNRNNLFKETKEE